MLAQRMLLMLLAPALTRGGQSPEPTPRTPASATQSPAARERVVLDSLLQRELLTQRRAWQAEEQRIHGILRHPQYAEPGIQRLAMVHCHTDRLCNPSPSRMHSSK